MIQNKINIHIKIMYNKVTSSIGNRLNKKYVKHISNFIFKDNTNFDFESEEEEENDDDNFDDLLNDIGL